MKIGQLIKKYRKKRGLTQLDFANALGYGIPQFISLLENGHSKLPLGICKKLSTVLELNSKDIAALKKALIGEYKKTVDESF